MAIWPFGRKSKRTSKPEESTMAISTATPADAARTELVQQSSDRSVPTLRRKPSRKDEQRRRRSSTGKLTKANHQPRSRPSEKVDNIPAVPAIPQSHRQDEFNEKTGANKANQRAPVSHPDRGDIPSYYFQNPMSASSLQSEKFTVIRRPPTLQNKRSAKDEGLMRRKSSKRKADDHAREQEIKAMSSPIPIPKRPTSHSPGILARDSRRIPGGMNRNFDRPLSDVSLPLPESMHSQMSVASDQHAFKVNAFDALSPRPTIRYYENPTSAPGSLRPSRTSTKKDKQPIIQEEAKETNRRIDDLVDDMDAGSIRELMERDRRRLEKKRISEQEKLERRLQRKAEKQRERDEKGDGMVNDDVEQKPEREKQIGLGIEGTSNKPPMVEPPPETRMEGVVRTPESWLKDPSRERLVHEDPFHDPVIGTSTSHLEEATPIEEDRDAPVLETAQAVRLSAASTSPPTSPARHVHEPSNLSQFSELAPTGPPNVPELLDPETRRDSGSSVRLASSWKSIFRRSDTKAKRASTDRGRTTPSEFSNTSRESVARQLEGRQMPSSAFMRVPPARSGTPVRTQSRFREDLPELPISPPDSRMQSPELKGHSPLPNVTGTRGADAVDSSAPLADIHPAFREEVALSRHASLRDRAGSPEDPSTAILSQSLASVDSEGSWLTGRPVKRSSLPQPRESASSLQQHLKDLGESDDDDEVLGTPEEETYMGSLTPAPEERPPRIPERKRPYMGTATALGGDSDDEASLHPAPITSGQDEGTWHSAVGKHPTIVRQGPGRRAKSREGLLNDFQNTEESTESSPTGDSPTSPENAYPTIQRATSVDVGKGHARHISAGSARLLNLPPRSSGDMKRFSASSGASGERSPLMISNQPSPRLPEVTDDDVD